MPAGTIVAGVGTPLTGVTENEDPLQINAVYAEITGLGFTVILNESNLEQLPFAACTLMIPKIGVEPELVAVNEGIFPVMGPAPKPIEGLLFVQVIVAPAGTLDKIIDPTTVPAQIKVSAGTTGAGV